MSYVIDSLPSNLEFDLDQIDWSFTLDDWNYWELPRPVLEPWHLDQEYLDELLKAYWDPRDLPCLDCGTFCLQLCGKRVRGS